MIMSADTIWIAICTVLVFFMQTGAGSRQAETVCAGIGLRRVEINPLSYDWKKEMMRIADGITAE